MEVKVLLFLFAVLFIVGRVTPKLTENNLLNQAWMAYYSTALEKPPCVTYTTKKDKNAFLCDYIGLKKKTTIIKFHNEITGDKSYMVAIVQSGLEEVKTILGTARVCLGPYTQSVVYPTSNKNCIYLYEVNPPPFGVGTPKTEVNIFCTRAFDATEKDVKDMINQNPDLVFNSDYVICIKKVSNATEIMEDDGTIDTLTDSVNRTSKLVLS